MAELGYDPADAVAVVGAACRLPGAADVREYWAGLCAGVDSISTLERDDLLAAGLDPDEVDDPLYVPAKGLLDEADLFDADFFSVSPREAQLTDPQHRVLLETAWTALEDAGHVPGEVPTGVFVGITSNLYTSLVLADPALGVAANDIQLRLGADADFAATRVSYKLGLQGPSLTVRTACSSSLVAIHLACQSLLCGECDLAVAGGVAIQVPLCEGYRFYEGSIRSPDGRCRPFDADAAGTVGSDGVGLVVLARLDDALESRDRVVAVIRGTAVNNDGADKIGFTAPSLEGQRKVIAAAHALAGVSADEIGFLEGHGTATALGDPIEVAALTAAFRRTSDAAGSCLLGSAKGNIGHTDAAAGVASLIKAALALEHELVPGTAHFRRPNPDLELERTPFRINSDPEPWLRTDVPRLAGVSSFGLGGTNAHAVLAEAPVREAPPAPPDGAPFVVPVSAASEAAFGRLRASLADRLGQVPRPQAADVAYTLQRGRRSQPYRRAYVVADESELVAALEREQAPRAATAERPPRIAFAFPGQGTQRPGMAAGLYDHFPEFARAVDEGLERVGDEELAHDVRTALLRPDAVELARRPDVVQLALFVFEVALAAEYRRLGVVPAAVIGHSLGEYAAACVAGVVSVGEGAELVAERARATLERSPAGGMLAVALSEPELEELALPGVELAAVNAARSCVVAGAVAAVEQAEETLRARGVAFRRLGVERAFHSALIEPVVPALATVLERLELREPAIPLASNVTGAWAGREIATPEYWLRHLRLPVRFAEGARTIRDAADVVLEVGPGRTLTGLLRRELGERSPALVTGERPDSPIEHAGAELWELGVPIRWDALPTARAGVRIPLPTHPFERRRYWPRAKPSAAPVSSPPAVTLAAAPSAGDGIAAIFEEVLGVEADDDDEFFELGGDSLAAVQVLARVADTFGREVPIDVFFDAPTPARLEAWLASEETVSG